YCHANPSTPSHIVQQALANLIAHSCEHQSPECDACCAWTGKPSHAPQGKKPEANSGIEPQWLSGAGSLLLLAAAQETDLLPTDGGLHWLRVRLIPSRTWHTSPLPLVGCCCSRCSFLAKSDCVAPGICADTAGMRFPCAHRAKARVRICSRRA